MNILAINCGSSSLKFKLFEAAENSPGVAPQVLASGRIAWEHGRASISFSIETAHPRHEHVTGREANVTDHADATGLLLRRLESERIDAVGVRIVHGGSRFVAPTRLNDRVLKELESAGQHAPLHNRPALRSVQALRQSIHPDTPIVAVFDTAFHHEMPRCAAEYAIPRGLASKHQIRRFGFHGLAHRYMAERYYEIAGVAPERTRVVTLQLGAGCSITAIRGGRSVDTSMGLTPLEGLVMATRSGDVDPTLASFLAQCEGMEIEQAEALLNRQSGLLGVSGFSSDMRALLSREEQGDDAAALAIDLFCYRAKKYLGAYLAALGGADAVIFGGGIGENSSPVRARICQDMAWCGLELDAAQNQGAIGIERRISSGAGLPECYVIPVDEERIIARDVLMCLHIES